LIWINEPTKVFIARRGVHELTTTILTADEVRDLCEKMLKSSGRRVDLSTPFVDAMLPDGSRLHVVIPDITRAHWSVNIRKFVVRATHLDDLVALGTLTTQCARFLEAAVSSGLNILVAGGTQAGKTTLLNCLAAAIPSRERVVTAEEVFELKIPLPDVVSMQCRQESLEGTGEIKLRRLVKEALRMRPSRIIVGEVRQEESLDLLMVPLVYVLITVFRVQAASYAVSSAAREAGRVYATSSSMDEADGRAFAAARMVMADSHLPLDSDQLRITCSTNPCLAPGSQVDVVMTYNVALPLVPRFFSDRAPASIRVTSSHLEVVDRYRTAAR
jgi:energy-coupling factor transporter ATP-binding protein EcfA2